MVEDDLYIKCITCLSSLYFKPTISIYVLQWNHFTFLLSRELHDGLTPLYRHHRPHQHADEHIVVMNRLQTAQNKSVRYILKYNGRQHIGFSDFSKLKLLDVGRRVDYLTLNLMYNIFHKLAPSYMCNVNLVSHRYNTRRSDCAFVIPKVKGQGSKSFKFNGIKLWNNLPVAIRKAQTKDFFKA